MQNFKIPKTTLSGSKVIIVIELTSLAQLHGSTSTLLGTIQKLKPFHADHSNDVFSTQELQADVKVPMKSFWTGKGFQTIKLTKQL